MKRAIEIRRQRAVARRNGREICRGDNSARGNNGLLMLARSRAPAGAVAAWQRRAAMKMLAPKCIMKAAWRGKESN